MARLKPGVSVKQAQADIEVIASRIREKASVAPASACTWWACRSRWSSSRWRIMATEPIYAGGTELLLAMKHQALSYRHLIDLKVIPGLNSIDLKGDSLELGATSTHRDIERSTLVQQKLPVLAELESQVANVRVRATGTLGGNICFAEPHSDPATLLLVLGGKVKLEGSNGVREMPVDRLIAGPYANNLLPNEILAKIVVPCAQANHRAAYMKFQVHERPTLGLAYGWRRLMMAAPLDQHESL